MVRAVVLLVIASACSSGAASSPSPAVAGSAAPAARAERPARVVAAAPPVATMPAAPAGGDVQQRTLDIALRSSPSGARAAVDGVLVGTTPTHYAMAADGRQHDFTFDRPGFVFVRYRFVPVQSGVIDARLNPVAVEDTTTASSGVESDDVQQAPEAQAQPQPPLVPGQPAPPPPSAKPTTKVGPEP